METRPYDAKVYSLKKPPLPYRRDFPGAFPFEGKVAKPQVLTDEV